MDIISIGRPPVFSTAMNGDLVDLTTLSTSELEQIIGPSGMEDLGGMMCPSPSGGAMYTGMPHESSGAASHLMMNGSAVSTMPLPNPPMMQVKSSVTPEQESRHPGSHAVPGREPWVEITEQPKQRGLRFRYQCEGRSAGSIPGENSTNENKTFPTIKIHNYRGQAIIVVSCVTKEQAPRCRPHPHSLVGKDCKKGVCTVKVKDATVVSFPQLGIQCAKKKDVEEALKVRKEINVDPYQTGFDHMSSNIDLNVVRLCFQVFLPDTNGKVTRVVPPVVSEPIQDKKAQNDLTICRVDRTSGKARGGDEVFLLCEKVGKDDIKVRFYEEGVNEETLWEAFGDFGQGDVHRQYAIVFKTPRYKEEYISRPVTVNVQLYRPSSMQGSEPVRFTYMPDDPDPDRIEEKRKRKGEWLNNLMPSSGSSDGGPSSSSSSVKESLRHMLTANRRIKLEQQANCAHTGGARGMSISSQGSESSLEPLSSTSSAAAQQSIRSSADMGHTTSMAQTVTSSCRLPSATVTSVAMDQNQLVQQFVAQQQQLFVTSGMGGQVSAAAGMSITSTASNSSQPVSLDESLLNLVTQPTSTLLSTFDMNIFQSIMEQGTFSSGDTGSLNMVEVATSSQEMHGHHHHHAPMQAEDYEQQHADFLEVQAALESLNQS